MDIIYIKVLSAPNIALIKYWGKSDIIEKRKIPYNNSLSITLDTEIIKTETIIIGTKKLIKNVYILNNKRIKENKEIRRIIKEIKKKCKDTKRLNYNFILISNNNFPTAAGIASSASGYSAMTKALSLLYKSSHNKEELVVNNQIL